MRSLSTALRLSLVVAAILVPAFAHAAWEDDLIEAVANPVFDAAPGTNVYYLTVLYDADGFGAGDAGPFYRMWFSNGKDTDANIGTAASDDGIAWVPGADGAGLRKPHHAKVLYDANGFGAGAAGPCYRIWYWDTSKLYTVEAIRTAESDDGISWMNDRAIAQDAGRPIITGPGGANWNRGSYGPVHLFYQPGKPNAGADPFDYEYVMYYDGTTGAFEQVGLGFSADGITWTRFGDDPVLASGLDWSVAGNWGKADPWDSSYVGFGSIVRDEAGTFHFWYSGGSTSLDMGIGYASSDDGIAWTKDAANPFIAKTAGTWYAKRAYTPAALYDAARFAGHGDNAHFKLWFAGRDDANAYHVGYLGRPVAAVGVALGAKNPDVAGIRFGTPAPLMQLAIANDDVEEVVFTELTVTLGGTAATGVELLRLYADLDADGQVGAADLMIDQQEVAAATVAFGPFSRSVTRSAAESWLVVAVLSERAATAQTLRAGIAAASDVAGAGADTGELAVALGSTPLRGNTMVIVEGATPAETPDDASEEDDGDAASADAPGEEPVDLDGDGTPDFSYMSGFGGTGGCSLAAVAPTAALPAPAILLLSMGLLALRRRHAGLPR